MPLLRAWLLLLMSLPALAAAESLRLVADPWPPFTDQRLPGNGLASDLVEQALERAGYRTHYAEVPWERAVLGLKRGDYDVLINAWYSVERTRFGHFSQPYLINRIRFLQRKGGDIRFQRLADLYPHSIAVVRGYAYSKAFDNDPDLHKVGVASFVFGYRERDAAPILSDYRRRLFLIAHDREPSIDTAGEVMQGEVYRHTQQGGMPQRMPYVRPWIVGCVIIAVVYVILSQIIWEFETADLSPKIEQVLNAMGGA